MYQVYKITNLINGKVYIGSSIDVERRWRQHKEASINENDHHYTYPLMEAFRNFGISNFSFTIVETVENWKDMIKAEEKWIQQKNCIVPNGYNQTFNTESPMFDPKISNKVSQTKREKYGKKVCEIDENNNIINIWNSLAEAGEQTGLNRYKISNVCNGQRLTTGNRIFRFLTEENSIIIPNIQVNYTKTNRITKNSKRIIKMDLNGNELQIYDSIALASIDNKCDPSGISKVCNGQRNTCGGFKWKYLNI